jgi:urea transport system ATP-binding protein
MSGGAGNPILYLDGVSVVFDGFRALNDLSLIVEAGELRAIIGPNGAGKTTMMDVITGKTRPSTGMVRFRLPYCRIESQVLCQPDWALT